MDTQSVYVRKRHGQKGRGGGVGFISTHRGTKGVGSVFHLYVFFHVYRSVLVYLAYLGAGIGSVGFFSHV